MREREREVCETERKRECVYERVRVYVRVCMSVRSGALSLSHVRSPMSDRPASPQ